MKIPRELMDESEWKKDYDPQFSSVHFSLRKLHINLKISTPFIVENKKKISSFYLFKLISVFWSFRKSKNEFKIS